MAKRVPTYDLYGEQSGRKPSVWLHCETIPSRSSLHHWEIRVHRHESFFQILYLQAGSGDAIFGKEKHTLQPLSVITVPPGVNHGFRFSKDTDGVVITVLASRLRVSPGDRSHLGTWLSVPRVTQLDPTYADGAYVAGTLTRLGAEYAEQRAGRNDLLEAYMILALQLTERLSQGGDGSANDENGRRMEHLNGLIHRHLRTHQPAGFYAAELGISPTHLNRFVKSMTGHGAHELITRRLLEEAKRELIFSFGSIQEIGYRLGFADPAYFSRFFLKRTGNTPRAWRIAERSKLANVNV